MKVPFDSEVVHLVIEERSRKESANLMKSTKLENFIDLLERFDEAKLRNFASHMK